MVGFIDDHRGEHGVEPICNVLPIAPSTYYDHLAKRADPARQGEVLGVNQSFASLARIVGPLAGMSLFSLHPSRALPYAASVVLLVAVAALVPRLTAEPAASRAA